VHRENKSAPGEQQSSGKTAHHQVTMQVWQNCKKIKDLLIGHASKQRELRNEIAETIDEIPITKHEIDNINGLNEPEERKGISETICFSPEVAK
jgi:hypothetical protein